MKKGILILIGMMITAAVFAQDKNERMKGQILAQKIAYITSELELTAEEAQLFWPVYNEYQEEMEEIKTGHGFRQMSKSISDEEAGDLLDTEIGRQQKEVDIRKKYIGKFKNTLPTRKVALLFYAEQQFKKKMLDAVGKRMKKRRHNRN